MNPRNIKKIKNIDVNLIGQRGVGYFEYQLAKNISPKKLLMISILK